LPVLRKSPIIPPAPPRLDRSCCQLPLTTFPLFLWFVSGLLDDPSFRPWGGGLPSAAPSSARRVRPIVDQGTGLRQSRAGLSDSPTRRGSKLWPRYDPARRDGTIAGASTRWGYTILSTCPWWSKRLACLRRGRSRNKRSGLSGTAVGARGA
jgi:hypothetical protein